MAPHSVSVDEDLDEAAKEVMEKMKAENEGTLDLESLQQYAIDDKEGDFDKALQNGVKVSASGLISVKSTRSQEDKRGRSKESKSKRKGKGDDKSRSNKKKKLAK